MALTNTQYDSIMRQYNKKQLANRHRWELRTKLAAEQIPRLAEINREIASISLQKARAKLTGGPDFDLTAAIADLAEERRALLRSNGLPEDFLELTYDCPLCKDTGYIDNRTKCSCFIKAETELLYNQSHLSDLLEEENFDHFSLSFYSDEKVSPRTGRTSRETAALALQKAKQFAASFPQGENLFLYGDTGIGKTFLSHCIARELLDRSFGVIYYSSHDFFDLLSRHTFGNAAETEEMFQYLFDCDLLIIDDLGTEMSNSFTSSSLFQVVNERLLRKKSTIISSNLTLDHFAVTYSERTFSRITSGYSMIQLFGDDIRLKKRLNLLNR